MVRMTVERLERRLMEAADLLRGSLEPAESVPVIGALLHLKQADDRYGDSLPKAARWARLTEVSGGLPAEERLRAVFAALANEGPPQSADAASLLLVGATKRSHTGMTLVIEHFGRLRLGDDDLAHPDVLGDAFESLLRWSADAASHKGGEFYTPRGVVRLLTALGRPAAGMRVYDPCVGTGGMLIDARRYVRDHGGDAGSLFLAGQDANSGALLLSSLNMQLHGAEQYRLAQGDALTHPETPGDCFDLVVSNPPFSMNYSLASVPHVAERMPYGTTPERGKADLMFLQHMLYMAQGRNGSVVTVMPQGVLFRGAGEREIRTQLLDADLIEAVIALSPNLFYGTGIPACVLVLRAGRRPDSRHRGRVLFINAEGEYYAGRAQNFLLPEHAEKIAATFHSRTEVPGFSKFITRETLMENADNLTVHRYVRREAATERQDLRAHLEGGMPAVEVTAAKPLLDAYGVQPTDLFQERAGSSEYLDFRVRGERPNTHMLTRMARTRESTLWEAFDKAWESVTDQISDAFRLDSSSVPGQPGQVPWTAVRNAIADTVRKPLAQIGLLDSYAVGGMVEDWLGQNEATFKALAARGFAAVVDDWCADVTDRLTAGQPRARYALDTALEHPVVIALLPGFLSELSSARERAGELSAQLKEAMAADEQGEADLYPGDWAGIPALRRARSTAVRRVRELEADMPLEEARRALDAEGARTVVLSALRDDLSGRLTRILGERRAEFIALYEAWDAKYGLSFQEIEGRLPGFSATSRALRQTPWSQQSGVDPRHRDAELLFNVIEAEEAINGEIAKLDMKQHFALLPVLDAVDGRSSDVERLSLGDVVLSLTRGAAGPSSTDTSGLPVIWPSNMTGAGLDLTNLRYLIGSGRAGQRLTPGDVLLGGLRRSERIGQAYRVAVWRGELPEATHSSHVLRLVPDPARLLPDYLAAWLRHPLVRRRVEALTTASPMSLDRDLLNSDIELPNLEEQQRLVGEIARLAAEQADRRIQHDKAVRIREGLAGRLLGGPLDF
ncbi:N-6 DNA methylase [Streptomyces europaeiscabiei]|uniref:N-6 DNA methylase n=1 Tax=Streptomyces europaeiscabiei TaxID=146819 RepID=UPI0029A35071|nr:N-6 DNA methylase [Streptomyces europaeiscabiei]MDX3832222.1 N-6 DNA methylase [Streptomyces europaeiscabiei]